MKPFIKVMVTEVTENDDGERLINFENHVHVSISFDGVTQFNVSSIILHHADDDVPPKDIEVDGAVIRGFKARWEANAKLINADFIFDQESVDEYLESFKETP